ncbi:MAG: hypothetical protein ACP5IJ_01835 [Candidatus Nanoarchaeia archaeon]
MATLKAQSEYAPLIILFVILIAIVAYAVVTTPFEREAVIGPIYAQRALLDIVPGFIKGAPVKTSSFEHNLDIIDLDFRPISEPSQLANRIVIERSAFSNKPTTFTVSLNKSNFVGASLYFDVISRFGDRELIVYLNNEQIFAGLLGAGPQEVLLPLSKLNNTNTIKIAVAPPGPAFWQKTSYVLSNVSFVTKYYLPEKAKQSVHLELSDAEIKGLLAAHFDCYAKQLAKAGKLTIVLNGNEIWSGTPSTAISFDIQPVLLSKTNNFEFSTQQDSYYSLLFCKVTTLFTKTPYTVPTWQFNLTNEELSFAKTGQANCWLIINGSKPLEKPLNCLINNQKITLTPINGTIKENICAYLQKQNTLSLYTSTDLELTNLKVLYVRKV